MIVITEFDCFMVIAYLFDHDNKESNKKVYPTKVSKYPIIRLYSLYFEHIDKTKTKVVENAFERVESKL